VLEVFRQHHLLKCTQVVNPEGTDHRDPPPECLAFNLHALLVDSLGHEVFGWVCPANNVFKLLFLKDSIGFLDEIVDADGEGNLLIFPGLRSIGRLGLQEFGKQLDGGYRLSGDEGRRLPLLTIVREHSFHGANIIYF